MSQQPKTLEEVAKEFDESKFIGYMTREFIAALKEFNNNLEPYGSYPRLYYTYEGDDQLWCFEFVPGTDIINILTTPYSETKDNLNPDLIIWNSRGQLD